MNSGCEYKLVKLDRARINCYLSEGWVVVEHKNHVYHEFAGRVYVWLRREMVSEQPERVE